MMKKTSKNYSVEKNKSELIKLYDILYSDLKDLARSYRLDEDELEKYFIPDAYSSNFSKNVLYHLCSSLQNSGMMHNSIKFNSKTSNNNKLITVALNNMDLKKSMSEFRSDKDIYKKFIKLGIKDNGTGNNKETNWKKYCKGLYDGMAFLYKENGLQILKNLTKAEDLIEDNLKHITSISEGIHGLGFALTCDWLKESGCIWLAKPDVHINEVVKKIISCDEIKDIDTLIFMDSWAKLLRTGKKHKDVTTYKLDKVIWLLCTGNFYLHETKIGRDMILQEIDTLRGKK